MRVPFSAIAIVILLFSVCSFPIQNNEKIEKALEWDIGNELGTQSYYIASETIINWFGIESNEKIKSIAEQEFEKYIESKGFNAKNTKIKLSYDEGNFTFKLFVYTEINGKKFLYNRNITSKELLFFKMNTKSEKKFMYGIAFDGDIKQKRIVNETVELGVGWVRYFLKWNEVEPSPVNLTGLDPKNNSHVAIAMKLYNWSSLDDFIYSLINESITPIIDIATGYDSFLPSGLKLGNDMSDLDKYIEHLYWHVRTVVHRYNFLEYWQAENEINWWWAHEIAKWRIGKVWWDIKVKDRILETITKAIRDEGKHKIIFNFEVDLSTYLIEAFRYRNLYDILGIDFYPWWDPTHLINWGQIFTGAEIFLKVLEARIIGKDLIVME
ncbi:MAG: hypothetical protein AB1779_07175, partial [Candidatus Thermoplasmatota archaeon]